MACHLRHAENSKVAVAKKEAWARRAQKDLAGQGLLAQVHGPQGAVQGRAGEAAEGHRHPHQAPIVLFPVLVALGWKGLGNISLGTQPDGRAVKQGDEHLFPKRGRAELGDLVALQAQSLGQKVQLQAGAGIAVRAGGSGKQPAREPGKETVGAPAQASVTTASREWS